MHCCRHYFCLLQRLFEPKYFVIFLKGRDSAIYWVFFMLKLMCLNYLGNKAYAACSNNMFMYSPVVLEDSPVVSVNTPTGECVVLST